ncbi:MAG TPA: ATP-binding protein [Candidatus Binataceae bacterium]|nr:ATP-binding protein [Candidatus Binataceae bacterium]
MTDLKTSRAATSDAAFDTHLHGLVWEARADTGELTRFGGEAEKILGPEAELTSGKPRFSPELFHPDDRADVAAALARVRATGAPVLFDARVNVGASEPIWVRSAVRIEERESIRYLRGVSFDISDLKRAQTEFLRARARLSFLASASRILAESLDFETTLQNVAKTAVPEIADWCAVRIIADDQSMTRLADVHSDPSREAMLKEMFEKFPPTEDFGPRKVIREGKSEFLPDTTGLANLVATDPSHLDLLERIGFTSYICVPMRGRERILGIISMAITDSGRRFTEADLELAELLASRASTAIENAGAYREAREELRRRENFIALLGHELRNPLSAIANVVTLLSQEPAANPQVAGLREILVRQTSQLSQLVNDLLDISRITRGKILLNRKPLDLAQLVARCVSTVQQTVGASDRIIEVQLEADPVIVDADEVRVEQICWNLLTNAVKFTAPGGRIEVSVARRDGYAIFSVTDDGAGISPEHLPNIFKPFHQPTVGSVDAGGMGLGLALVEQLTRLHDGSVSVSSDGIGTGSRFEVRLRLSEAVAQSTESNIEDESTMEKRKVLVVDDNPDALESLKMLLEYIGHEIAVASDGRSAIESVLSWRPEVALIDIGLPDLDGYEVAGRLRAMDLDARPLLVALTGYGQPEDRMRALSAGFDVHLTKPVDLDELTRILSWKGEH